MNRPVPESVPAFPNVTVLAPSRPVENDKEGACPGCACQSAIPRYGVEGMSYRLVVCTECGVGRLDPHPSTQEISAFYPQEYYGTKGAKFEGHVEQFIRFVAARRLQFLVRGLKPGARVLDVGCGRGVLLQALADRGFEPYGVEITEDAMLGADPRARIRVAPDLADAEFDDEFFDCVIVWHVLEHLPDPRRTLAEIERILKPGGRAIVAVPNFSSWQARWAGSAWFHLDLPRHIYHFPVEALNRLMVSSGFEALSVHHFSLRQNPFGWVQSFLNKNAKLERNGLYSLLHSRDERDVKPVGGRFLRFRLRLAYFFGMPVGVVLSVIAALARRGATVHVNARKPLAQGRKGGQSQPGDDPQG